eukprot:scaffold24990_cov63-Phaeocystis_antarctica.AAC.5
MLEPRLQVHLLAQPTQATGQAAPSATRVEACTSSLRVEALRGAPRRNGHLARGRCRGVG